MNIVIKFWQSAELTRLRINIKSPVNQKKIVVANVGYL